MTAAPAGGWIIVVPVKSPARGKSRLEVPGADRAALARAIALDTIAAARACSLVAQVVVVSDDGALPLQAADIPGLRFAPEGEPRGLNQAIATGMGIDPLADADRPTEFEAMARAALLGDLPALRPDDLAEALRLAASVDRAVVADAEGTGSTLVTAAPGVEWRSAFGADSFARHVALGCVPLEIPDASTLRHDVDTSEQLAAARSLGLGPRTSAVLQLTSR